MKVIVAVLIAGLIATVHSQGNDMMNAMLLMRLIGGNNQGTSSSNNAGGRAGSSAYGLGSLFGGSGRGGINPLFLMGGGGKNLARLALISFREKQCAYLILLWHFSRHFFHT